MQQHRLQLLLLVAVAVLLGLAASAAAYKPRYSGEGHEYGGGAKPKKHKHARDHTQKHGYKHKHTPSGPGRCQQGTPERPIQAVQLADGTTFCLRLPRFLANPEKDFSGTTLFPRTYQDTCGLYGLTYHPFVPRGGGPDPHLHLSDEEYFVVTQPSDVLRIFSEAGPKAPRTYPPGMVPGYNVPPVHPVGHIDVAGGHVAYSPKNTPHSWKGATDLHNFIIFWVNGFVMEPSINIPQSSTNASYVLAESALWSSPTDITSAMFEGPQYTTEALQRNAALPAVTFAQMQRLQDRIDAGERCFPNA